MNREFPLGKSNDLLIICYNQTHREEVVKLYNTAAHYSLYGEHIKRTPYTTVIYFKPRTEKEKEFLNYLRKKFQGAKFIQQTKELKGAKEMPKNGDYV